MTTHDDLHVRRFAPEHRADFFRLHGTANGAGWCFCVAWWVEQWDGWGERTAAQNRALRTSLLDQGEYDGYLLYRADEPLGWCQAGPRDRLAKLVQQFGLEPDPDTWAITCFFIAPKARRQGLAAHLLREVLDDLRTRGVRRVEAFPKRGPDLGTLDLWNGPEGLFRAVGFHVAQEDGARPVLALNL